MFPCSRVPEIFRVKRSKKALKPWASFWLAPHTTITWTMKDFPNSTEGLLKFWLTHMDFMAPQKNATSPTHMKQNLWTSLAHGFFPSALCSYTTSWWFQPIWKILYSQIGSFPQVEVKTKKTWNHHPDQNNDTIETSHKHRGIPYTISISAGESCVF